MKNDLVSVIIPAYKCEKVISSAIDSVLNQTYRNFEVIVINDGSPDNLGFVLEKYKDHIRYIHQENGGVSKARNTGISNSKGKYVAFLDADDTWDKNKISIQMDIFNRHPNINMLFSGFHVTREGKILSSNYKNSFNFFKEYKYDFSSIFSRKSMMKWNGISIEYYWGNIYDKLFLGNFILPSSVIAKKISVLKSGCFNESIRVAEETDFFLRYASRNNIGFVDYPVVCYELPSPDNLSGKSNMEKLIKNAYAIQIDSFIENQDRLKNNLGYYMKGISNTYCRLAYYYLSEINKIGCRKYSLYAMKLSRGNIKPYLYYFMSCIPEALLVSMANMKSSINRSIR